MCGEVGGGNEGRTGGICMTSDGNGEKADQLLSNDKPCCRSTKMVKGC